MDSLDIKTRLQKLEAEIHGLYLVFHHPRTPWYARWFVAALVAYALSPIDLIPDFVPVLGYLDDLVVLPAGIALALRMIPEPVWAECRQRARSATSHPGPASRIAGAVIIAIWLTGVALCALWAYRALQ